MNLPTLSVIVPNYNHGRFLPTCLDAILGQSAPPTEVIVVDDGSTDNSLDVLDGYARRYPNVRVFRNDRNRGVSYTLNRGIDAATGDFLFFPAADDEVKAGLFEKSLRLLAQHPQAALSCTISQWIDIASGLKWYMAAGLADRPSYLSPAELVRLGRKGKLIIPTSSAIYRKEPLARANRFIPELRWHSDWFAATVTAFRHGLCFVPEPLSDFYLNPTSYYNRGRKQLEHFDVLRKLLSLLSSPEFADVVAPVRDSAALALFGLPIVRLALARRESREFVTPMLLYRASRRSTELIGKKVLPRPLARLVLRVLYHHGPQNSEKPA